MTSDATHPDLYGDGEDARVFVTHPNDPDSGRTFVWAATRWFERGEDDDGEGPVAFQPLPYSEADLRGWLAESDLEMTEIDDAFAAMVRDEFGEQIPLYPEAPELSDESATG